MKCDRQFTGRARARLPPKIGDWRLTVQDSGTMWLELAGYSLLIRRSWADFTRLQTRAVSANVLGVNSIALDASSPHRLLDLRPRHALAQPPGRDMQAGVARRDALHHSAWDRSCGGCGGAGAVPPLSARHDVGGVVGGDHCLLEPGMLSSVQRQGAFNHGTTCACRCRRRPHGP